MDKKRIFGLILAFLIFLVIVFIFSFLADIMGEKSPTSLIRIISWIFGSLVAFKIFEHVTGTKDLI